MKDTKPSCVLRGLICGAIAGLFAACQDPATAADAAAGPPDLGMGRPAMPDAGGGSTDMAAPIQVKTGIDFRSAGQFRVGNHVQVMATADLNLDGRADLVTGENTDNYPNASVLLGKGDGSFASALAVVLGPEPDPYGMVIADFDGDGKPDIATANQDENVVGVLLGRGDGTFKGVQNAAVMVSRGLAVRDLQGDGKLDLVTIGGGGVSILLGKSGGGSFQPAQQILSASSAQAVAISDVDGDGVPDVITTIDGGVYVLPGAGDGSFQPGKRSTLAGTAAFGLAVADLNGDGKPDLVLLGRGGGGVDVCLGRGDGTFALSSSFPVTAASFATAGGPFLAIADFNGDDRPDIAALSHTGVIIVTGDGHGGFSKPTTYYTGADVRGLVAADFNGDGAPDLALADAFASSVSVLLNQSR